MSVLKKRILLVSDIHYTTELVHSELKKLYPDSNTSAAAGKTFGKTQREKVEKVYEDIIRENECAPLDAVLVLGDLSVDDYDFRNLPVNYCMQFKKECLDRLPCGYYVLPGNHDSYPNDEWRKIFDTDREFVCEVGDAVFIMADTFCGNPAKTASGASLTMMNEEFIEACLEKYRGRKIFICAHHIDARADGNPTVSVALRDIIKDNGDIVFLFRGHTHHNEVIDLGAAFGDKKLVDIGGYGYCGIEMDYGWEFNIYDYKWAWGYQMLEIYDDKILTYHVKTDNIYNAKNGFFEVSRAVLGAVEYPAR